MGLSATPITAVSTFTAYIYPPAASTPVLSADVQAGEQGLTNRTLALADGYLTPPGLTVRTIEEPPMMVIAAGVIEWNRDLFGEHIDQVATGASLAQWFSPPHGNVLSTIAVWFNPGGHVGLPAALPTARVFATSRTTGAHTMLSATTTDPSASVGAYQVYHSIPITGIAHTVDRASFRYGIWFVSESGANSLVGLRYYGAEMGIVPTVRDACAG